jgi:dTDP-4-amino-4,6-dideoxygalactose transaminase
MKIIPYSRQYIDDQDIKFVSRALKGDLITTGNYVKKFEIKISKLLKVKYAIACNTGTSALHLALIAIGLKTNDVIIMPSINFIAVYNMARFMDARIYLADVDPLTGQMTPKTLVECIKKNKLKKIKAIITMYLGGYPENIVEFYKIKKKFNCYLIEDACHALGSKYLFNKKYLYIGSCKHSDISTFSLHPVKTITTGEGGIVTTNNKELSKKILLSRSHGIERHKKYHWKYQIRCLGFNYRLSDINAALGLSQLKKMHKFIVYRKKVYDYYSYELSAYSDQLNFPKYNEDNISSYHLYLLNINFKRNLFTKDNFIKFLKKNRIISQYHYIPIYKFKIFNEKKYLYNGANEYLKKTVSLPIFFNLKFSQHKFIIKIIKVFLKNFSNKKFKYYSEH